MRIWVTRPERDATVLRAKLVAQGHEVFVEPLLLIDFEQADPLDLIDVQALIATSRNGVRAAAESDVADVARQLPLFAVGPGTASTAEALGFDYVIKGHSTAEALLPKILSLSDVNGGALLHLAGGNLAFDLAGELRQMGYHVIQPTVYIARAATHLSIKLLTRIAVGDIDGVILLSPRTAQTYVNLVMAHQIERTARRLRHFCLSSNVAARLSQLQPEAIEVARVPNIRELLALTGQATANCD
ncbi:MAG: uroporphyrinogen-III synthase [Hyphomicrobiaceae bacterium]